MTEVLVLLRANAHITARDLALTEPFSGAGVQVFGDRVLTARLSADTCLDVAAMDGVEALFSAEVPLDLAPDDPVGRLSIDAWNSRRGRGAVDKPRIGDGVAWDDPGFAPEGRTDKAPR